jgi:hypothetical protein
VLSRSAFIQACAQGGTALRRAIADLALFKLAFGSTNGVYDLDGNGVVNFADLGLFKQRFGQAPGPSALRP